METDYAGIATLITAISVLIAALAAAYATVTQTKKVKEIHVMTQAIDYAVNMRDPESQTIGEDVGDLHEEMELLQDVRERNGNGGG